MVGRSPVVADAEQRRELLGLSQSRDRGEADRSRAILLTLRGWTSPEIADAFGVREDTVRLWRSAFMRGGVGALRATVAPGPAAIKAERALDVAEELLSAPVANRPNWTLPRLASEIEQRSGLRISRSRLSVVLRKKGGLAGGGRVTRGRAAKIRTRWTAPVCAGSGSKRKPRRATSSCCSRTSP